MTTRDGLVAALRAHGWHVGRASVALGIARNTLYQRLARAGLDRDAIALLKHRLDPWPTPRAVAADAYAEAAAQIRALTEACVALAAQVTSLQDAIDRERAISAHLAHKLETYAVEAAA